MNRSKSKNSKTKGLVIEKASKKSSAEAPPKKFPIVGIGASAGGLEAFTSLLGALPTDTGMAFVFVQHLDPTHESLGPEILSRSTRMDVRQVEEGMRVEPNCVYLIPPNHNMVLSNCVLTLEPRTLTRGQHLTIDSFFQSLAADQKGRAVGVVLSGAASDGTQGLKAIKAEGGLSIAQDPKTAKHWDMPKSAIAAGVVDLILPPDEIARELARIAKHPYIAAACESGSETQTESEVPVEDDKEDQDQPDAALRKIFAILRIYSRIDFSNYKHATLKRRIQRRMMVRRTDTLEDYAKYLREDSDEVKSLFNDILINVTEFFRDPESYKALVEQVFPQLTNKRSFEAPLRIWVAACATGEEAYSLAISLVEFLGESGAKFPIQIFATDVSEPCLKKARAGIYSESNLRGVSKERLKRFFDKVEGGYKINKSIRQLCLFSRHDLSGDPAFGKLDLITCRNLLIYFAVVLQKRVIPVFHYALNSGGFLWLGKSESTGTLSHLFTVLDKTHRLYSKANVQTPMTFRFPASSYLPYVPEVASQAPMPGKSTNDFERIADRIALSKYAPPSVVVNYDMEILQFRGETSPYLQFPSGPPSTNLLKMVRSDLLYTLRMTIHEARVQNRQARHEGLAFDLDGKRRKVGIQVVPANPHEPPNQRNFLIFFEEPAPTPSPSKKKSGKGGAKADPKKKARSEQENRVAQLEQESSANKLYQQAMFEDFEATREELTAGNEELQSTNEELQSTNEELETAKEEVQSSNEELTTVNDELRDRNAELTVLMSDLNNILVSVDIPLVIVDGQRQIRRFTPSAARVFSFIGSDIGRPLSDIRNTFDLDLDEMVTEVVKSLVTLEKEVQDNKGHWMRLQIRPFKTIDNKIDGAVIACVDIDAIKRNLDVSDTALNYATSVADTVDLPFVVLGPHLLVKSANRSFYEYFDVPKDKIKFSLFEVLGVHAEQMHKLATVLKDTLRSKTPFNKIEMAYESKTRGLRSLLLSGRQIHWIGTESEAVLVAFEDITERKLAAKKIKESEETFRHLANTLPQMIWMANSDGVAVWYNQRWYDYTGMTPDDMKDTSWWKDVHHPDHMERVLKFASEAMKKGDPWELTFPLKSKSGEWHSFLTRTVPIRDSAGELVRWVGTSTELNRNG